MMYLLVWVLETVTFGIEPGRYFVASSSSLSLNVGLIFSPGNDLFIQIIQVIVTDRKQFHFGE